MPSPQPDADLHQAIVNFLTKAEKELSGQLSSVATSVQQAVAQCTTPREGAAIVSTPHANASDARDGAFKQLASLATHAGSTGANVLRRLAPYGLQMFVSAAAYSAGLGLFQLLGHSLRISSNTRVLSSCLGCLSVGMSSAFAGHMSRHVHHELEQSGPAGLLRVPPWHRFDPDEALLDAVVGLTCFKLWRGQFRSLMPSNLCEPGAWAVHSIPVEGLASATGNKYATGSDRLQLQAFFKRDGCHHCGTKKGTVIGDHIPPTKLYNQMRAERQLGSKGAELVANTPWAKAFNQVKQLLGSSAAAAAPLRRQRFYPQCKACMLRQADALRNNKSPLLSHWRPWRLPTPGFMPGVVAALRPLTLGDVLGRPPPPASSAAAGKGKSGSTAKSGRWGAGHANTKEVAVQVWPGGGQPGPATWQDALWWAGRVAPAAAASEAVGVPQQVWGDEVVDASCDVARGPGGLWSWAKRMDEAAVWTSLDLREHYHSQQQQHQQAQGPLQQPHGQAYSVYQGLPLQAQLPLGSSGYLQQQQQHLRHSVVVEEYEEEGEDSGSLSVHTATSQPLSGTGAAAGSPPGGRSPWSIELPSTPHPTPGRDSWDPPGLHHGQPRHSGEQPTTTGWAVGEPQHTTSCFAAGEQQHASPPTAAAPNGYHVAYQHSPSSLGSTTAGMQPGVATGQQAHMGVPYHGFVASQTLVSGASAGPVAAVTAVSQQQVWQPGVHRETQQQGVPAQAQAPAAQVHGTLQVRLSPPSHVQQQQQRPQQSQAQAPPQQQQFFWAATSTSSSDTLKPHRYSSLASPTTPNALVPGAAHVPGANIGVSQQQGALTAAPAAPAPVSGESVVSVGGLKSGAQAWAQQAADLLAANKPAFTEAANMAVAAAKGAVSVVATAVLSSTTPAATSPALSKGIHSSSSSPVSWPLTSVA